MTGLRKGADGRRQYPVGVARRQQILEASRDLFGLQGYRGASMRDIAGKVGLTLPGLLHYFPSKEALLEAVLQHRDDTDTPWFEQTWDETGDFRQAVHELVRRNMARPGMTRLFVTLSAEATDPDHPAHGYFRERYRESRELFSHVLDLAKTRGEAVADASGPLFIAVLDGLQIQWLIDPEFDMPGELDHYLDTILTTRGAVPQSAPGRVPDAPATPTKGKRARNA